MEIKDMLLTRNPYSRPGTKLNTVKAVAIHYTGNAGSSATGNRNYFESLKVGKRNGSGSYLYASSHYIIGLQGEIIRCIPESEWSYATNARNKDTISIEICHPKVDGKFTDMTYKAAVELVADICKRYNLDPLGSGLIRHYDVTGKKCPLYFVTNPDAYQKFRKDVYAKLHPPVVTTEEVKTISDKDHWAYATYTALNAMGLKIFETRFDDPITRGESFTLVARALSLEEKIDVPDSEDNSHWACKFYDFLIDHGFNISEKRFDDKITRGESMVVIANYLTSRNGDIITKNNSEHWADIYYDYLNNKGMKISEKRYSDKITRAELMSLIYRVINL